jgi:hypothetical protein
MWKRVPGQVPGLGAVEAVAQTSVSDCDFSDATTVSANEGACCYEFKSTSKRVKLSRQGTLIILKNPSLSGCVAPEMSSLRWRQVACSQSLYFTSSFIK